MYKVFHLSKEIIFTSSIDNLNRSDNDLIIDPVEMTQLHTNYQYFIADLISKRLIFVCGDKCEFCFNQFSSHFKSIEAAGGLVKNEDQELLMIFRNGMWDLPKGKMEKGESPIEAAEREVIEETGIGAIKIGAKLKSTYHIYALRLNQVLKKTHWYEMKTENEMMLIPQQNEGITKAEWMNKEDVEIAIKNTYDSLKEMMVLYLEN